MKILTIEDNPADMEILRELLIDTYVSSFELVSSRTLAEGMSIFAGGDIDFVILDLGLPDSQGIDTLRSVRTRSPFVPIVVLTGFDDDVTGILALREGAQDYLVKGQITGPSLMRSIRYANERNRSEQELVLKNNDLDMMNEELRQNIEELSLREKDLLESEANLKKALTEKEILLSEIHHRVKNNLAAFISLLSLDGAYEDNEGGRALRKDLQNRARSMALIHETLYRTGKFSNVDMDVYLTTLVSQIAGSYAENTKIRTVVDVHGMVLDLPRATTTGLIVNELVTNSFKYAFPPGFDCLALRGESCSIRISLCTEDGTYVLTVADNGRGFPEGFDPLATKSLGLKLVKFLTRHQLRSELEVRSDTGTEFIFRLKKAKDYV